MVRANLHNLVIVGAMAVLVLFLLRKLLATRAASIPVVGQVLATAAA